MKMDSRTQFKQKWFNKGCEADDPFDRFFCFWIALVVAAQRAQTQYGICRRNATDAEKVQSYFSLRSEGVLKALDLSQPWLQKLAGRKGTEYQDPILDTGDPRQRESFDALSQHFLKLRDLDSYEVLETMAELLNKIRNNVFHGNKVYDDADDRDLLDLVNPLLESILRCAEALDQGANSRALEDTRSQVKRVHG
jgi:hypothetical protein